jgi:hypothetical protein
VQSQSPSSQSQGERSAERTSGLTKINKYMYVILSLFIMQTTVLAQQPLQRSVTTPHHSPIQTKGYHNLGLGLGLLFIITITKPNFMAHTHVHNIDILVRHDWNHFISAVNYVHSLREFGFLNDQFQFERRLFHLRIELFKNVTWYCMKNNLLQENLPFELQQVIELLFFMRADYFDSFIDSVV